jgi:hypothetical protein
MPFVREILNCTWDLNFLRESVYYYYNFPNFKGKFSRVWESFKFDYKIFLPYAFCERKPKLYLRFEFFWENHCTIIIIYLISKENFLFVVHGCKHLREPHLMYFLCVHFLIYYFFTIIGLNSKGVICTTLYKFCRV